MTTWQTNINVPRVLLKFILKLFVKLLRKSFVWCSRFYLQAVILTLKVVLLTLSSTVWNKSWTVCLSFSHLPSPPFDRCQHLSSPSHSFCHSDVYGLLNHVRLNWSLSHFPPEGRDTVTVFVYECVCVCVRMCVCVGLRVLSASIIQKLSATTAHVMLWREERGRERGRGGRDWHRDVADLFLVAFSVFPYSFLTASFL